MEDVKKFIELFKQCQDLAHFNAVTKGFYPEFDNVNNEAEIKDAQNEINVGERLALVHSEISEALEAVRNDPAPDKHCPDFLNFHIELADTVIRIMDLAGALGVPLAEAILAKMKYNQSRPYKHGKKF